jgi:hypothetical protein
MVSAATGQWRKARWRHTCRMSGRSSGFSRAATRSESPGSRGKGGIIVDLLTAGQRFRPNLRRPDDGPAMVGMPA